MQPLSGPDLVRIRHLVGAGHPALVIEAVLAGTAPARVWVDDATAPRTALVWDGAHCVYLVGAVDDADACREVFRREIAPAGRGMLKAYTTAAPVFAGYAVQPRERVLYRSEAPTTRPFRLPPGYQLEAVNDGYATLRTLVHFGELVAEVESCWGSLDAFRRRGFGFYAHDGASIVCWCTA